MYEQQQIRELLEKKFEVSKENLSNSNQELNEIQTELKKLDADNKALYNDHKRNSDEIFNNDISGCVSDNPYIEGYVFTDGGLIQGYAMLAKSFSTEFGRPCIWVEDIFVKAEYRARGIATGFFSFIENKYPGALFRLEVEPENEKALSVYKRCGFDVLPYMEMKK